MTITIHVSPDTEDKLKRRASARGQDVPAFVQELVEREAKGLPTFDEILQPVREGFAESGLSDEELDRLFEDERDAAWKERQTAPSPR